MPTEPLQCVPLTCHGHSRPVPHISFSTLNKDGEYYLLSACKGEPPVAVTATTTPLSRPRADRPTTSL